MLILDESHWEKRMSSSEIPHVKCWRPAQNAAVTLHPPALQFHTHTHTRALLRTYVYCLIRRCSKRSIPESREKNLRTRALSEFCCKGSSSSLLIPGFCNTYNTYIWGGHPEHIVPFPMFKYSFMWTLDVVITVCVQTEVLLVQIPRSRFKQKGRTWMQIQILDIETKLLMVFYELPFLGTCFCVWSNVVLRENHYDSRYLKTCF